MNIYEFLFILNTNAVFNQVAMLIQIIHTISQSYLDILDNLSTIKSTLYYTKFHYALIRL